MKKVIFCLVALFALTATAFAATVTVSLKSNQTIDGSLISYDDTTLVLIPAYYNSGQELKLIPERVRYFSISGIGRFDVVDGKFVPSAKAQAKLNALQEKKRTLAAANPNEVVAKAFKSSGGVCLGIGVPSLLVGTILVAYGNTGLVTMPKNVEEAEKNATKARCSAAGYVFLPMGAALTIVGIPLRVHGKRIGELNVNYTGNGAGMSFNF